MLNVKKIEYSNYLPDFVVEIIDAKYMVEIKAENELRYKGVQAKKNVVMEWSKITTDFEKGYYFKVGYYFLILDTTIVADRSFVKLG